MTNSPRTGLAAGLLLMLAACSSVPERPPAPSRPAPGHMPEHAPRQPPANGAVPEPARPSGVMGEAARRLYLKARKASAAGHDAEAAGLLERALRIEPRHPLLWHNLAVVRFNQGRYTQAEALARKANSLSGHDRALRARNWRLIAAALREQGKPRAASRAEARARRLLNQ